MGDVRGCPLIAVDIGNARIKLGLFRGEPVAAQLPEPERSMHLAGREPEFARLSTWLDEATASQPGDGSPLAWYIGSVNRSAATRLIDWLRSHRPEDPIVLLSAADLPLSVRLERPDMVGVDRLLDALAANYLRQPDHQAVVVDVGSAITVDLISAGGEFLGGAILPGIAMSARALHEFTDLLPEIDMSDLHAPPPALGTSTVPAMQAGLFWGAVGAVRMLVDQLADGQPAEVFLTGGAGPTVAQLLGRSARFVPHLTLAGIALAAWQQEAKA